LLHYLVKVEDLKLILNVTDFDISRSNQLSYSSILTTDLHLPKL